MAYATFPLCSALCLPACSRVSSGSLEASFGKCVDVSLVATQISVAIALCILYYWLCVPLLSRADLSHGRVCGAYMAQGLRETESKPLSPPLIPNHHLPKLSFVLTLHFSGL